VRVDWSKQHIRFYWRENPDAKFVQVSLDLASV
jgi:hypothetical protein